jgi:hypothetical protein
MQKECDLVVQHWEGLAFEAGRSDINPFLGEVQIEVQ